MLPLIYNTVNKAIVQEMQAAGLYDILMQQIARVPAGPKQIFVFLDSRPGRLTYYLYHRGFHHDADNGFSAITIQDPDRCPQLAEVVAREVEAIFDSPAKVLWVENPAAEEMR